MLMSSVATKIHKHAVVRSGTAALHVSFLSDNKLNALCFCARHPVPCGVFCAVLLNCAAASGSSRGHMYFLRRSPDHQITCASHRLELKPISSASGLEWKRNTCPSGVNQGWTLSIHIGKIHIMSDLQCQQSRCPTCLIYKIYVLLGENVLLRYTVFHI